MIDKDGTITYSQIVGVNGGEKGVLLVYPNPVKNELKVLHSKAVSNASIEIFSTEGKMLLRQSIAAAAQQTTLNVDKLSAGSYTLKLMNGSEVNIIRFTKQ